MNEKRLRILHTIRQGTYGGGETYLYNLVSRLDKQKFEPLVLSFTEGNMVSRLRREGIRTFVIPTLRPFNIFIYNKVRHLLRQEKIDIVHIHGTRAATNTLIPAFLSGTPTIYTVHGWSFHTGTNFLIRHGRMLSERYMTRLATATVCGSNSDRQAGEQYCRQGKYHLIYNSIDTALFNPDLPVKNIKSELGFLPGDFIVSFIARLTFQKDPLTFIRAIPQVMKRIPHAKFLMVGDGELKQECLQLAHKLQVQTYLTFTPFRNDIKELLYITDIFVLPSLWEVIPLGLLEAMAMEKCCIATDIPGTNEAIMHRQNGFLIPVNAPSQLADSIIELYLDKELRFILQNNARKTVVSRFDIHTLVQKNQALYLKIIGKRIII